MVVEESPHHGGVARERHGGAELVEHGRVARRQLGLLVPRAPAAHEDVGRARLVARVVVPPSPHHDRVARERHGAAEQVGGRRVARGQFGILVDHRSRWQTDPDFITRQSVFVTQVTQLGE